MRAASDVTLRPVRSSVDATRSERSPAGFIFSQSIRTSNGKEKKEAMLPSGWSFFFFLSLSRFQFPPLHLHHNGLQVSLSSGSLKMPRHMNVFLSVI